MIGIGTVDFAAMLRTLDQMPSEAKLAAINAYRVHCTADTQQARDAGARFFYKVLMPFVSAAARPN